MANAAEAIQVDGLKELQASLKAIDGQAQKQLRLVMNEAANIVVAGAKSRAPSVSGRLRSSIRASSDQRSARVSGGSARVPYFGFIDYGGRVGKGRHGRGTGSVHRTFIRTGRILYPAYFGARDEVQQVLGEGLRRLVEQSGMAVTEE